VPVRGVVAVVLVVAVGAGAQEAPAVDPAVVEARRAFEEGRTAFRAGDFETALARFEHAYKLDDAPVLLYNIARANEELGRLEPAIYHYELYLKRLPDAEDRADVERRVRVMRAFGAKATASAEPPPPVSLRPFAYTALGLGVAGLVTGGVFAARLSAATDDYDAATTPRAKRAAEDDAESAAMWANVGFVAGGALVAAGVALWLLEPDDAGVAIGPGYAGWRTTW
jgi:tetratricopeptide (TPR) repeat protein